MNENDRPLKSKEELEEENFFQLVEAMQLKQRCVEYFMHTVSSFVKFPEAKFRDFMTDAAKNLVEAHEIVMRHARMIGNAYKADVKTEHIELNDEHVELNNEDVELKA